VLQALCGRAKRSVDASVQTCIRPDVGVSIAVFFIANLNLLIQLAGNRLFLYLQKRISFTLFADAEI
jgi:hypothetical protein